MGEIFIDFVQPFNDHIESDRTWSMFVQMLEATDAGSGVAEEGEDLETQGVAFAVNVNSRNTAGLGKYPK